MKKYPVNQPASVARSNARPTGDQEVSGSIPCQVRQQTDNVLFSIVSLSLLLIQEGKLSVSGKRKCTNTC